MVSHHGSKKGVRHHGAKHGAKPKQGKYSMPLIGILVLAFLVIGSVVSFGHGLGESGDVILKQPTLIHKA